MPTRLVIALCVMLAAAGARADERTLDLHFDFDIDPAPLLLGVALGSLDALLTTIDVKQAILGREPGRAYGLLETLVAAPQLVHAGVLLSDDDDEPLFWAYAGWMAALTAHGLWAVAVGDAPEQRAVTVVPTAFGGVAVVGRF